MAESKVESQLGQSHVKHEDTASVYERAKNLPAYLNSQNKKMMATNKTSEISRDSRPQLVLSDSDVKEESMS